MEIYLFILIKEMEMWVGNVRRTVFFCDVREEK